MEPVSRRDVLSLSAAAFQLLVAALPAIADRHLVGPRPGSPVTWRSFIEALNTITDIESEEQYVRRVDDLLGHVNIVDPNLQHARTKLTKGTAGYPNFLQLERSIRVEVALLSFDPGDSIMAHDHPQMTGVMMCLGGKVAVQNYDAIMTEASGCVLRRVSDVVLGCPQRSTLTTHRANIHQLDSPMGGQLIDIFTPPYDERRVAATRWYSVGRDPLKRGSDLYAARVRS